MKDITVCLLSGIGNAVMAIPLIEALRSLGYVVRILVHPMGREVVPLFEGEFEVVVGERAKGFVVIPALWRRCLPGKVSDSQILADDLDPLKFHESEANISIARKLWFCW